MTSTHQTKDAKGRPYVQITFLPHNAKRKVTRWAIKVAPGHYLRASAEGGPWEDPKAPEGVQRTEIILTGADVVERPAGVDLHYARMELV